MNKEEDLKKLSNKFKNEIEEFIDEKKNEIEEKINNNISKRRSSEISFERSQYINDSLLSLKIISTVRNVDIKQYLTVIENISNELDKNIETLEENTQAIIEEKNIEHNI